MRMRLSIRTTSFTALCSYVKPTDAKKKKKKKRVHFLNRRPPYGDGRLIISEKCLVTPNFLFGFRKPLLRSAFTAQKYCCISVQIP